VGFVAIAVSMISVFYSFLWSIFLIFSSNSSLIAWLMLVFCKGTTFPTNRQGKEKKFLTTCTKLGVHIKPDGLYAKGS
jgi:hypothetical protein